MSDISNTLEPLIKATQDIASQTHSVTQGNLATLEKIINSPVGTGSLPDYQLPALAEMSPPGGAPQLALNIETVTNIDREAAVSFCDTYPATLQPVQEQKTYTVLPDHLPQPNLPGETKSPVAKTKNLASFFKERQHTAHTVSATGGAGLEMKIITLPSDTKPLTDKLRETINKNTLPDFSLLLSCITECPVIFLTPGEKKNDSLKKIYHHGESLTRDVKAESFSDAIIITKKKYETILTIKRSSGGNIVEKLPPNDYTEILTIIPKEIYRAGSRDKVFTFMSIPTNLFRAQGKNFYHDLKRAVNKEDFGLIQKTYKESSIFESAVTGGMARDSFYQQMFEDIKENSPGTAKMIAFVTNNLYLPPAEDMKLMTAGILHTAGNQDADTSSLATYICALAEKLPESRKHELHTAIGTIIKTMEYEVRSYVELMEKSKRIFINMLHKIHLEDETTKHKFRYYYDQFIYAIQNTSLPRPFRDIAVEQLFLLRGYVDSNFPEKLLTTVKEALGRNLKIIKSVDLDAAKDICTLEDRVFSLLIINAYLLPRSTVNYLANHFKEMLSRQGESGNTPMAFCHLTDYLNNFISTETSIKFFGEKFNAHIKKEHRANGLTMLLACGALLTESEIYNYNPADMIKTFRIIWNIYHSIANQPISENQCLVIKKEKDNAYAFIDKQDKWHNNLDMMEMNLTVMTKKTADNWLRKCDFVETEIFRHPDTTLLFNAILQSLPTHPHREKITEKIIAAYLNNDKWPARPISILNKHLNSITSKMPRETIAEKAEYANTVLSVTDIQITLLTRYFQDVSNRPNTATLAIIEEIITGIAGNVELIDKAIETKRIIELFKSWLKDGRLKTDYYLDIINNILSLSLSRKAENEGRILRSQILNSALTEMGNRMQLDKLFLSLANITTNRSDIGFNIFDSLVKSEVLHSFASPLNDKRRLSEAEREAMSKFITAQPVNFTLLMNACIDLSGNDLNTGWVVNTTHFFDASPAVQHAMLKLIRTVLQEDPTKFIQQCLAALDAQLAQTPSDKSKNMAKAVNAVCSFLKATPPSDIPLLLKTFGELYLKLQQHNNIQDIFPSIQNSLKAMVKEFTRQQRVTIETLPEQLQSLVIVEKTTAPLTFFEDSQSYTASSTSESETRILKRRDLPSATETPPSDAASASVRVKQRVASKPITARTLYCNLQLDQLHHDADVIRACKDAVSLFLSDASAAQLNLHPYKFKSRQSRFYTFDIKMPDQSWTGRSDLRLMVLKGSNNRYFLLGIATHDELKKPSPTYLRLREKEVDQQFFQREDRQLRINHQTQQLEWLPADNTAP